MDAYKESNRGTKVERFSAQALFAYNENSSSKIFMSRNAVSDMTADMNRSYETAGFVLGHFSDGKATFKKYASDSGVVHRGKSFAQFNEETQLQELAYYAHIGYNAIMFVHTHIHAGPAAMMYMHADRLSASDKRKALEFTSPYGKKLGFRSIYECVLSIAEHEDGGTVFMLHVFDVLNGAKNTENFQLTDEIAEKRFDASKLLRRAHITFQTFKYLFDAAFTFNGTCMYANVINNIPVSTDNANRINEMINNMELPYLLNKRIYVLIDENRYVLVVGNLPGIISSLYRKHLNDVLEEIAVAASLMFFYYINNIE